MATLSHTFECGFVMTFKQHGDPRIRHWLSRREHRFEIAQPIAKIGLKVKIRNDDVGLESAHQRNRLARIPCNRNVISQRAIALRQLAVIEADN